MQNLKGAALTAPFAFYSARRLSWCLLAAIVLIPVGNLRAHVLTGSWQITLTPDRETAALGGKEFTDRISFVDGKFTSVALQAKGFKPSGYRGDFEEREAEFDLEQESETDGIVVWIGEVRGGKMAGRLQWKRKDGTNLIFNFTGANMTPVAK